MTKPERPAEIVVTPDLWDVQPRDHEMLRVTALRVTHQCGDCGATWSDERPACHAVSAVPETADLRAAWVDGWMQGARQMTTWPSESLHAEAVRQYERRAALDEAQS